LHELAIGAVDGKVSFNQSSGLENLDPEGWDHSGSIKAPVNHLEMFPWVKFEKTIEVKINKLDTWADVYDINDVDLIWADVQGAEEDLILGAEKILRRTRFIYTEYYDNECYQNQITLAQMNDMLGHFLILRKYENDALFQNYYLNKSFGLDLLREFDAMARMSGDYDSFCSSYGISSDFIFNWCREVGIA
jgi:FkbM family methyltransferase